jgi:hypothetical protein
MSKTSGPRQASDSTSDRRRPAEQSSRDWSQHEHVSPAIQNEARNLVAKTGSLAAAKHALEQAVEGAADTRPDASSDKDVFARQHGFTSYLELFEASSVVRSVDGKNWCVTALPGQRWMLWNERDLKAHTTHASFEEARRSISGE